VKTAGTRSITASEILIPNDSGTQTGITVSPAAASRLVVRAPAGLRARAEFRLTVTAVDADGNVVTGDRYWRRQRRS
jgi:hypothetical protein